MNEFTRKLYDAQDGYCAGCGLPMIHPSLRKEPVDDPLLFPSRDHVVAISKGGDRGWRNQVAMHLRCNGQKGDRDPTGCELIWHGIVLVKLREEYAELVAELTRPRGARRTLGDIWPKVEEYRVFEEGGRRAY